jgi:hypothetical protein
MNFFSGLSLLSLIMLVGCSSTKKEVAKDVPIDIEKETFTIAEASHKSRPAWIEEPSIGDDPEERVKSRYFVNRAEHSNRRLCEQSAETRAAASIAKEIAQFLKNSYTEGSQDQGDDEATKYMEETLARESQSFVVGAQVHRSFWERRRYQIKLGADKDKTEYACFSLIKMPKKEIEKAVTLSRQKLLENISNPQIKQKATKALAGAEQAFINRENAVVAQESKE